MSYLLYDHIAHVVKFVLKKKNGSGTSTYYLGTRAYDADELFSGSPVVYPVLVAPPRPIRSIGREVAILHTLGVDIYGKNHLSKHGESFFDLLRSHEIVDAAVTLQHYRKPYSTTGADASTRQTLVATGFAWADDILTVACKDTWFKNKEVSKRFTTSSWTALEDRWYGEYGGIVFGNGEASGGVIIDAPVYDYGYYSTNRPYSRVFTGFLATSHNSGGLQTVYVRNLWKDFVKEEWVAMNRQADPQSPWAGTASLAGSTPASLQANARALAVSPTTTARLITAVRTWGSEGGTVVASSGEFRVNISYAQYLPSGDSFGPLNPILVSIQKDPGGSTIQSGGGSENVYFQLPNYILFHPEINYFVMEEWSNFDDATNYIIAAIKTVSGSPVGTEANHYSRSNAEKLEGWTKQTDIELGMGIYAVGDGDDAEVATPTGTSPYKYSYYHMEAKEVTLDTSEERLGWDRSVDFKVAVKGLKDDGSGTYTGSASAVMANPADIIRFLLLEDEIGVGLSSSDIDTTIFGNTRTSLSTNYNMSFAIDRETHLQDLIPKICRHSRTIFYKTRAGKLAIYFPVPLANTFGAYLHEGHHQDDFAVIAVTDSSVDAVINDVILPFGSDPLNLPKDAAVVRRAETNSYKAVEFISDGTASYSDSGRLSMATASIALYGRKQWREAFDLYAADSMAPRYVMQYRFDRYNKKQKQAVVRVPLIKYYAKDFWDTFHLAHTDLAGSGNTFQKLLSNNDGTAITCYYEGVPVTVTKGGTLAGEVVAIEEDGDDMLVTIETVSSYQR